MSEITTVGLDLAKNVFQVHGADARIEQPQVWKFGSCLVMHPDIPI